MRKPLTLFETLIAAVLAALLLSNLLSTLFRMTRTKSLFQVEKNEVLARANLHLLLKEVLRDTQPSPELIFLKNGAVYIGEERVCEGISSLETIPYYFKDGVLFPDETWGTDAPVAALCLYIDNEPYPVTFHEGITEYYLCK